MVFHFLLHYILLLSFLFCYVLLSVEIEQTLKESNVICFFPLHYATFRFCYFPFIICYHTFSYATLLPVMLFSFLHHFILLRYFQLRYVLSFLFWYVPFLLFLFCYVLLSVTFHLFIPSVLLSNTILSFLLLSITFSPYFRYVIFLSTT